MEYIPDYSGMFSGGQSFQADPSLGSVGGTGGASWYSDPNVMMLLAKMAGNLGSSLSNPGSPGDVMGKMASTMAESFAGNKALPMAANSGLAAPLSQATQAGGQDPLKKAESYKKAAGALKTIAELDPSHFPAGTDMDYAKAFSMDPLLTLKEPSSNPTIPAANAPNQAGPSAAGVPQMVQSLPAALAMTMTPEQVRGAFDFGSTQRAQEIVRQKQINDNLMAPFDRENKAASTQNILALAKNYDSEVAYRDWERSPEGQAFKLKYAGESTKMAHEMGLKKDALDREALENVIKDGGLEGKMLGPGLPDIATLMRMSMIDKAGGTAVVAAFNSINDYKAAREVASMRQAEIKEARATRETADDWKRLEAADRVVMQLKGKQQRTDFEVGPAGDVAFRTAQTLGTAMSPNDVSKLKEIDIQRKLLMDRLKIPYSKIPVTGSEGNIVVTPEDLKRSVEGKRAMAITPNSPGTIMNYFGGKPATSSGPVGLNPNDPAQLLIDRALKNAGRAGMNRDMFGGF